MRETDFLPTEEQLTFQDECEHVLRDRTRGSAGRGFDWICCICKKVIKHNA